MEREKAPVCDSARLGGFTLGFNGNFIWALSRYFLINRSFGASAHRVTEQFVIVDFKIEIIKR